jgi:hypothetical protein
MKDFNMGATQAGAAGAVAAWVAGLGAEPKRVAVLMMNFLKTGRALGT